MTTVATQVITPSVANDLLTTAIYNNQRPVRPLWAKYLAEEMSVGSFKQNTLLEVVRVKKTGALYLIDGQHRLTAVKQSGKPQTFVVLETEVDNDEDVARLYYRIDQGLKRNAADQMRVLEIGEAYDLTYSEIRRLASAVTLIENGFMRVRQTMFHPDIREMLVREYADAGRSYFATIARRPRELKSASERSATLAVALVTFRYSIKRYGDQVEEFWDGVIFDDGIPIGDARKPAHRHLMTVGMQGGAMTGNAVHRSPAYSSRYLARCFNAFVSNDKLSYPKVSDVTKPIEILGSPFDGK